VLQWAPMLDLGFAGRPRVLHVVQTLVAGGAETAVRALCTGLPAEGIDVGVVSVYASALAPGQFDSLGVPVTDLGRSGRRDLSYFRPLVETLRRLKPDIVHAHLHTGKYAGRLAAMLAAVPSIAFTIHGDEPGGPIRWLLDRVLNARTARFILFSNDQKVRFASDERVPLERIAVIPNGVAIPAKRRSRAEIRAELGLPQDAFLLYSAARLSREKNQRAAIEAVARARASGLDDLHLVLAGDGPESAELRARSRSLGLRDRVHFLGFRSDASSLCHAMDLFILPSLRERMPLALGEAMLSGLPPVVTPWPGAEEFVRDGDSGFIAGGYDAPALAAAVLRAHAGAERLSAVGERAREQAGRTFDLQTMVRSHAELYRTLSGKPA
jgi:glycosyltransferase involved in cell wall biosynthesis